MGVKAVDFLLENKTNLMVGLKDGIIQLTPLEKAIKGKTSINKELLRVSDIMSI
jgi:6-phosphofructokinase 1